jgi:23S rRNA pseudouridine1911/1915/1917 synthase
VSRPVRVEFLYEDDDLIAVDKPEGLPTIAPEGSRGRSLYDVVTDHIRKRNPKGRAAVVHRLDRDTSGVMVFAKNAAAKTRLMGSWNELVAQRRYVALVDGSLPASEGILESWLSEASPGRMKESRTQIKGALRAVTHYRVLGSGPVHSLVELSLETGRKHQIRIQLAGIGCPVSGDGKYGSRTDPLGRLCLHATLIEIAAVPGAPPLRFESPAPPGFMKAVATAPTKAGGSSPGRTFLRGKAARHPEASLDSSRGPRSDSGTNHTTRHAASNKPRHEDSQGHRANPSSRAASGRGRKRGELPEARPGGRTSNSYRGDPGTRPGTGPRKPGK